MAIASSAKAHGEPVCGVEVNAEFVVAAAEVLDECVSSDVKAGTHLCRAIHAGEPDSQSPPLPRDHADLRGSLVTQHLHEGVILADLTDTKAPSAGVAPVGHAPGGPSRGVRAGVAGR
jgi:hypothetical protein